MPSNAHPSLNRALSWITLAIALAALLPLHSPAQELSHRLILKDGSYQLVSKYEVKGDRVRYMSAERDEWEELPSSLVDWPATEKYEKDRATSAIPEAAALDKEKETEADRLLAESRLPQVAPGLRLPEASGVFLLDNFEGGPQLVEMQQTEGDINRNTRSNIFRGALNPIASAKQTIELEGEHATVHSHVATPSIYLNVEEENPSAKTPSGDPSSAKPSRPNPDAPRAQPGPQQPQQAEQAEVPFDRFRIVRAKVKGGNRILGDLRRNVAGKVSQNQDVVKATIDRVAPGWFKLTPSAALAPVNTQSLK